MEIAPVPMEPIRMMAVMMGRVKKLACKRYEKGHCCILHGINFIDDSASTDRADTPFSDEGSTPPVQETRQLSRQAILKRKQIEREEREAKRVKLLHQQREQARMRSKELKARNTIRRQLDEDERQLLKKVCQIFIIP